jgi:hypothetical protein
MALRQSWPDTELAKDNAVGGRCQAVRQSQSRHDCELPSSVLELSNLGRTHPANRSVALVAISRSERNGGTHHPLGPGARAERVRRLHEHRNGPQPAAGADYECLAHPVLGISSKRWIDLLRPDGADAGSGCIPDAGVAAPMAACQRLAHRPSTCRLHGGNMLAYFEHCQRNRLANTTDLMYLSQLPYFARAFAACSDILWDLVQPGIMFHFD